MCNKYLSFVTAREVFRKYVLILRHAYGKIRSSESPVRVFEKFIAKGVEMT